MKLTMENATHNLIKIFLNALNNKLTVGGIFCHHEKAFDCVSHNDIEARNLWNDWYR
jgi:hypothetical protein